MKLRLDPPAGFRPDDVYTKLLEIGQDRTDRDARQAMAALLLLLINHIADDEVVDEALTIVRELPRLRHKQGDEHHG